MLLKRSEAQFEKPLQSFKGWFIESELIWAAVQFNSGSTPLSKVSDWVAFRWSAKPESLKGSEAIRHCLANIYQWNCGNYQHSSLKRWSRPLPSLKSTWEVTSSTLWLKGRTSLNLKEQTFNQSWGHFSYNTILHIVLDANTEGVQAALTTGHQKRATSEL